MWRLCRDEHGGDNLIDEIKYLILNKQVNVNLVEHEKDGETPLHKAARSGHTATVEFLVKSGATVDCKTNYGWTPLHKAARSGHTATVEFLLKTGATVDCKNHYGLTPLQLARKTEVVELLKKFGASS